jgi:AcrR family transcriptional regulator
VNSRPPRSGRRGHGSARRRSSSSKAAEGPRLTREERKQRTRTAILDAALRLLEDHSFSGLSLREVAREAGIVPGAFYRHFESMDALGLALIDESFRALRDMLRRARAEQLETEHVIARSVAVLSASVSEQRLHWRFIARERSSGVGVLRYAIRSEIRLITSELAIDLARFPALANWTTEDLGVLAGLFVNSMVSIAEALGETEDPATRAEIHRTAAKQLRMIVIGMRGWRSA